MTIGKNTITGKLSDYSTLVAKALSEGVKTYEEFTRWIVAENNPKTAKQQN